jgi:hypothetical protein
MLMLLGFTAVVIGGIFAWKLIGRGPPELHLRRRYVRGEIDDAEFERQLKELRPSA